MKKKISDIKTSYLLWMCGLFFLFGVSSIYRAYQLHGIFFLQASFERMLHDPIYQYAVLDLGCIFSILLLWVYQECQAAQRSFWYWPIVFFVFGTPGLAIYLILRKKDQKIA